MSERELFLSALEIEDPTARAAHLQAACAGDTELLARVEALLASHESRSQFLNTPVMQQMSGDPANPSPTIVETGPDAAPHDYFDGTTEEQNVNCPETILQGEYDRSDEIPLGFLQFSTKEGSLGRLAHYEIEEVLGRGAFGIVLKAFDEKLHRVVAIKVLSPEMASTSPARKRFLREARSSAAIRHDNVVGIYAVEDEPIPYLVMEYVAGQTLQRRLDEHGPLDIKDVLRIGQQIANGLAAAHARDLIHRDIKPGNILLETSVNDHVKITDFGLARTADDASMTQSGMIAGTPMYMAPEQAQGQKLDQRADLFSFGSVLYQMLSGRPPFRAPTTMAVLKRVTEDTPRPIQEVIPEVPGWVCEIVAHLHAKDPDHRYASATEVSELLAQCLSDMEAGRTPQIPAPAKRQDESVAPARSWQTRPVLQRPLVKVAAAALVLLACLGITEATGVTKIAKTVIRLATGEGTLVIETDDPGLKVAIDGEEVTINGGGVEELTLRPGEYEVAATKDGQPVKQELVSITRDGRTVVRMSLEGARATARSPGVRTGDNWHDHWPDDAPAPAIAPFDAEQAQAHQEAWAEYLDVPVEYENSIGMKFRLIPPGEFLMGSTPEEIEDALEVAGEDQDWREWIQSEAPQHKVILTQPIYLGTTEVTQSQYVRLMENNRSEFSADGAGKDKVADMDTGNLPVEKVSWNDAAEFCTKLSQQEELKPFYYRAYETVTVLNGTGYRLPTEAEWEFACRAGTTTPVWSGDIDDDLRQVGWFGSNSDGRTHAVAELSANPFGLFDMHGNVYEWVQDGWDPAFYEEFAENVAVDPFRPILTDDQHVLRGGHWGFAPPYCRSSSRLSYSSTYRSNSFGFRVALVVDAVKQQLRDKPIDATTAETNSYSWPEDAPAPAIAPFDAEQARQHQQGWAEHLGVPVEFENSIGMRFRLIPPGEFLMGSSEAEIEKYTQGGFPGSEDPPHPVVLTQPFYLGVTEVTQQQYQDVMAVNPSHFCAEGEGADSVVGLDTFRHPVENVSYADCIDFCNDLGRREGIPPVYFRSGDTVTFLRSNGYRLPTEAQWEYACRAGTESTYWFGEDDSGVYRVKQHAWISSNSGKRSHAVAQLSANPFGLHEMLGNVWEICEDGLPIGFLSEHGDQPAVDPTSPRTTRLSKGGAWDWSVSPSMRYKASAFYATGFRVTLTVDAVKELLDTDTVTPLPPVEEEPLVPEDAPSIAVVPFDKTAAASLQQAWADYLGLPVAYTDGNGIEFVLIPPGRFTMGNTEDEIESYIATGGVISEAAGRSEAPRHEVILRKPFYLGKYEVTQQQYEAATGTNPSQFSPTGSFSEKVEGLDVGRFPVESISWAEAVAFCQTLTRMAQLRPHYFQADPYVTRISGNGYRLPTEAEWEFACRAGTESPFWCGDESAQLNQAGWNVDNSGGRTHAVGELRPNPFGLYDITGNLWELCFDGWYADGYPVTPDAPSIDPVVDGAATVARGGAFDYTPRGFRSGFRLPAQTAYYIGFRVVLSADGLRELIQSKEHESDPDAR
ncbi:MAG: hypothetical protein DWQ34_18090 [Planctomycetota bacterium]|nr:MAG: hypothetical protein DWQ34_18090 [Planctomycetota bacterium]REJ91568.1 MAG: hypothetical protein DWQ29_05630 [Planctomycetota bacterium]REK21059.1 MAG: hypothetical protein DWQ41_22970 [Planctomycetota bacterium]REK38876.1 MAG: hypothetical protein DWQ45_03265 [Planctomycetota bacterium]